MKLFDVTFGLIVVASTRERKRNGKTQEFQSSSFSLRCPSVTAT